MNNRNTHRTPVPRVLHVITRLDCGGSAENTLLTAIGSQGKYLVHICCGVSDNPPSENETRARAMGIRIMRLPNLVRNISLLKDVRVMIELVLLMRRGCYDLVHTHTSKAGILGRVAARLAGIKTVVHTPHGHIFYGYFSALITRFFVLLERLCTRLTSRTITLTQCEKDDYVERGIGEPGHFITIYSGVELQSFLHVDSLRAKSRGDLGLSDEKVVAGCVARLVSIKNHDLIVSAAALLGCHENLHFVLVGDGVRREELLQRIRRLNLEERFTLTGWRNDIPSLLSAFDIFVMCSLNEGMGRAFVEAQAAGLPVIGSRVGGIPEVVYEGRTGFLVDPHDPQDLADRIEELYTMKDRSNVYSGRCRQWVNPRFSSDYMVERIHRLYQELLSERPS